MTDLTAAPPASSPDAFERWLSPRVGGRAALATVAVVEGPVMLSLVGFWFPGGHR